MNKQMFYVVTLSEWDHDWESEETYYFKTEKEADIKIQELENENHCNSYEIDKSEVTFEELKEMITVSEFEDLFDIVIDPKGIK